MRSNDGEGLFYFEVLYLLGLLADVSQDAAISVQDLAVDKVGSMGSQEHAGDVYKRQFLSISTAFPAAPVHQMCIRDSYYTRMCRRIQ